MNEFQEELKGLAEKEELLNSMKKSVVESDKEYQLALEKFLVKHLGISHGGTFTLLELIKKTSELK